MKVEFAPDADAHPTTIALVTVIRELLTADAAGALALLAHSATFLPTVREIPDVVGQNVVAESGEATVIGVVGLLNAMLRRAGADEIAFEVSEENEVTRVGARLRTVSTILADESVTGYDPNKAAQP